jgi:hypothetical protein
VLEAKVVTVPAAIVALLNGEGPASEQERT